MFLAHGQDGSAVLGLTEQPRRCSESRLGSGRWKHSNVINARRAWGCGPGFYNFFPDRRRRCKSRPGTAVGTANTSSHMGDGVGGFGSAYPLLQAPMFWAEPGRFTDRGRVLGD